MKVKFISRYEIMTDQFLFELLSMNYFRLAGIFWNTHLTVREDFERNGFIFEYDQNLTHQPQEGLIECGKILII